MCAFHTAARGSLWSRCPNAGTLSLQAQFSRTFGHWSSTTRSSKTPRIVSPLPFKPTSDARRPISNVAPSDPFALAKQNAAFQAVKDHLKPNHRWIGIGSGSTVVHVVTAISAMEKSVTNHMTFVSTGDQSRSLIEAAGLRLGFLSQLPPDGLLDICFDGADEIDPDLNLIKGGGACLLQEKVVVAAAKKFVCVADYRKLSPQLGTTWTKGIPIEVLPLAATRVLSELRRLGSIGPTIRQGGSQKAGPVVTDNSMWIIDAPFPTLTSSPCATVAKPDKTGWEPAELSARLSEIPGIIETGLFTDARNRGSLKPSIIYLGMEDSKVKRIDKV